METVKKVYEGAKEKKRSLFTLYFLASCYDYMYHNYDVANNEKYGLNPFGHYLDYGYKEYNTDGKTGRKWKWPSFETDVYTVSKLKELTKELAGKISTDNLTTKQLECMNDYDKYRAAKNTTFEGKESQSDVVFAKWMLTAGKAYLVNETDVLTGGYKEKPWAHFMEHGAKEGRDDWKWPFEMKEEYRSMSYYAKEAFNIFIKGKF